MTNQQREMIRYNTQDVIKYLIENNGITMEQSMKQFYLSGIFEKLCDVGIRFYLF